MKFEQLFGRCKPVIAMLHLKGDGAKSTLVRAQEEARCYLEHGVEALMVENYFGSAFDCAEVLAWLQKEYPQVIYGVNILGDIRTPFELAAQYGAKFVQIDSVCGHLHPKKDEKYAAELAEYRRKADVVLLGGVRFKYQAVRSGRTLEQDLQLGMQRCDAIVVTGDGTGMTTPIEKVQRFRQTLGDFPLVMGAGVRPETLPETFAHCDGAIVGSYFKQEHRDVGDVYAPYVQEFMKQKRAVCGE